MDNDVTRKRPDTDARRAEILAAGLRVLARDGWKKASMNAIAREAKASKETLYAWFGDRDAFFAELVAHNAAMLTEGLGAADPALSLERTLDHFGERLLTLLLGPTSLTLNRAAIASVAESGALAHILTEQGRGAAMGQLKLRIEQAVRDGELRCPEGVDAVAEDWLGLLKGDMQLMALLDRGPALGPDDIAARATRARRLFMALYGDRARVT